MRLKLREVVRDKNGRVVYPSGSRRDHLGIQYRQRSFSAERWGKPPVFWYREKVKESEKVNEKEQQENVLPWMPSNKVFQ